MNLPRIGKRDIVGTLSELQEAKARKVAYAKLYEKRNVCRKSNSCDCKLCR